MDHDTTGESGRKRAGETGLSEFFRYQFVRANDFASDAIAIYSDGAFSHVDILLDDGRLLGARSDCKGGAPAGVQIRTPDYASWSKQVIIALPCTLEQKQRALDFATLQLGKPYDPLAIVAFVAAKDWRLENAWFCSELGARVGEVGALWSELYSPANHITPVGLALVASSQVGRVITVVK